MHFTNTSILLLLSILSASTSAQGLTQNATCANACTAARACDSQCAPGTSYDIDANTDAYVECLCQSGCLCNAEICLQCCDAAGVNGAGPDSCPYLQPPSSNVLYICSYDGTTPAQATPAEACFVYGNDGNGNPTSTYVSGSPFPSSVASFISGLLPLTNVSVAATSLISGQAGATPSSFPTTGKPGSTSLSSQATAIAGTTNIPSQKTGAATMTSTSSAITSAPTSTTGRPSNMGQTTTTSQPVASSQKSGAERTRSMVANGISVLLALSFRLLVL
ncbi:hypothetical protein JMJ35_010072 [Cladonia borealis]|uniref:GPI anchored protein n=1 Tax=Cladonia borealis TaxID=184061 RepID=A0AA39QSD6_9LECA|nr:hypothetical protein JMJ35_010072 [Cladonia borealis]